jgi:hypothetical protein
VPKRFLITAAIALFLAGPGLTNETGFDGTWVIDKDASKATFEIPASLTQKIRQDNDEMVIVTTWREPRDGVSPLPLLGVMVSELRLKTDGHEQRGQVGPFAQASKTTVNGGVAETEYTAAVHGQTVNGHWKRTLSPDGRQMQLEITQSGSGQSAQGTLVFKRK